MANHSKETDFVVQIICKDDLKAIRRLLVHFQDLGFVFVKSLYKMIRGLSYTKYPQQVILVCSIVIMNGCNNSEFAFYTYVCTLIY